MDFFGIFFDFFIIESDSNYGSSELDLKEVRCVGFNI